ncbi:hypothetical protein NMY22_g19616 [Coprinellus aureogranulatus]|nr:hypothetical protein NMY22_g19616 [Coprinellus aureogranulatus]
MDALLSSGEEKSNERKERRAFESGSDSEEMGIWVKGRGVARSDWEDVDAERCIEGVVGRAGRGREGCNTGSSGLAIELEDRNGGIRASLYNAVTEEEVEKLVKYMREFVEEETQG